MNPSYESKLSLKLFWHYWSKIWQEIYHLSVQGGKHEITENEKFLLPNDTKFIVKAIEVIHQPTLDTLYGINKK